MPHCHICVDFLSGSSWITFYLHCLNRISWPWTVSLVSHESVKRPCRSHWCYSVGGGVGLAAHAPFRIATENTVLAMPEAKIGYSPDVGASYFLSRLDGEIGTYLALTSETLKARAV